MREGVGGRDQRSAPRWMIWVAVVGASALVAALLLLWMVLTRPVMVAGWAGL